MAENKNSEENTLNLIQRTLEEVPCFTGYDPAPRNDSTIVFHSRRIGRSSGFIYNEGLIEMAFDESKTRLLAMARDKANQQKSKLETLDFPDFRVVELRSQEDAIAHGKHTGWCTADPDGRHYKASYSKGQLYVFYRKVGGKIKRRPSYQFYKDGSYVEFRKKGNERVDLHSFALKEASEKLGDWMLGLMQRRHEGYDFQPFSRAASRDLVNAFQAAQESLERLSSELASRGCFQFLGGDIGGGADRTATNHRREQSS